MKFVINFVASFLAAVIFASVALFAVVAYTNPPAVNRVLCGVTTSTDADYLKCFFQ